MSSADAVVALLDPHCAFSSFKKEKHAASVNDFIESCWGNMQTQPEYHQSWNMSLCVSVCVWVGVFIKRYRTVDRSLLDTLQHFLPHLRFTCSVYNEDMHFPLYTLCLHSHITTLWCFMGVLSQKRKSFCLLLYVLFKKLYCRLELENLRRSTVLLCLLPIDCLLLWKWMLLFFVKNLKATNDKQMRPSSSASVVIFAIVSQ